LSCPVVGIRLPPRRSSHARACAVTSNAYSTTESVNVGKMHAHAVEGGRRKPGSIVRDVSAATRHVGVSRPEASQTRDRVETLPHAAPRALRMSGRRPPAPPTPPLFNFIEGWKHCRDAVV